MTDCLYRSDNLLVRAVPAEDADVWFVTFDNHAIDAGLDRPGFGEAFLASEGCSAIHVIGRGNDWYQYPDMPLALAAIRDRLAGARRVVTYGSSMGGYAAIRFAGAIGAQAALALSPQYSNDPRITPWETRWADDAHRIAWLPEGRERGDAEAIVVYDPADADHRHAALIAAEGRSILVPLRHAGHPVSTFLSEVGLLRPLVQAVRRDRFDRADMLRQARHGRSGSSVYLSQLALAQPPARMATAMTLAERARAVTPDSPIALQTLGTILSRVSRHDEAIAVLEDLVHRSEGREFHHIYWLAEALQTAGRMDAAFDRMAEVTALTPGFAHLWAWRAYALARHGQLSAAIEVHGVAVRLAPSNRRYRQRMWRYRLWHALGLTRLLGPVVRGDAPQ